MKTEEIINKYKRIYVGIFKYLVYVLILVFGIIISINQIKKYKQLDQSNDFIVEKAKLKGRFDKIYNIDGGEDTKIHIIQGEFENTGNLLFSTNNLVSYKGITLPKNIFLYKDIDIKNLNHFESGNYQIQEIEKIGNNIVFNSADQIENTKNNFFSLPLTENSIYQTFYLKGLHQPINIKKINQHYVSSFLENFYIYDISKDYKGLSEIFYQINKTNYKPQFCDNVLKYLNYSQDTNKEIESILTQCGDSYILYFDKFKSFLEIQDQVNKGYINEKIYTDTILNNYKLISYQQKIYDDVHKNIINKISLNNYIDYLQNILKKNTKINQFNIELTYWFNNYYLLNILEYTKYTKNNQEKEEMDSIIQKVKQINKGDTLIGYVGLEDLITNKNLKTQKSINVERTDFGIINTTTKTLLDNIRTLSFFKIIQEKTSNDKIKINGYFSIKNNGEIMPIYSSIILNNKNDQAIINKISIDQFEDLNKIINEVIKEKDYTIQEMHQYIQDNIQLFMSEDTLSTCELIENKLYEMQEQAKDIDNINLMKCDTDNINILKEDEYGKIYYKIGLNNFDIKSIMISNKQIQENIKGFLENQKTNNITIVKMIENILNYRLDKKEYVQEINNNIIITIEDFQKFLGLYPKDIVEDNGEIIFEFILQGVSFIGTYNTQNKTIKNLRFKYSNPKIDIDKDKLIIKNFELILKEENQNQINGFVIDTINYLKQIDTQSVDIYQELP